MNKHAAVSVIVTVRNEAKTIEKLLAALSKQTVLPEEVVIVDGGSSDQTIERAREFAEHDKSFQVVVDVKKGNRSIGRNQAISLAKNELIAITDSGCTPRPEWIAELLAAHQPGSVVAGYAVGKAKTPFQKAAVPYFLVMPDRVDPKSYLPATRSMLIEKKNWEAVGRFDEDMNTSEDFIFAKKIATQKIPIIFNGNALVDWSPTATLKQFFKTMISFSAMDIRAGIFRPKIVALYGRYAAAVVVFGLVTKFWGVGAAVAIVGIGLIGYLNWAIIKNLRYVGGAWYWLPVLQLVADAGVMLGTGWGAVRSILTPRPSTTRTD